MRVNVPLADLISGSVVESELYPNITNGDKLAYNVVLRTKTKTVVMLEPPNQPNTDFEILTFRDESVAKRALAVALNIADACR
jgi:hypothetical protein